jgi:DNA-binding NtrC family response regulator
MSTDLLTKFIELNLIGNTPIFTDTLNCIQKVAACDLPVLVQGETGTGKENAARAIHYLSPRAKSAFVPINCGALHDELIESELFGHKKGAFTDAKNDLPGLVEVADGGTLFLDEVDSLSLKAQASLLRFLQNHEYRSVGGPKLCKANVRVLAASNIDFDTAIQNKAFRKDLFYRLNVLNVCMPPLRKRAADIPLIANSILKQQAAQIGGVEKTLSTSSCEWLCSQHWPGNVRELENVLLRLAIYSDQPELHFLSMPTPIEFTNENEEVPCFKEAKARTIEEFEINYLNLLLLKTSGNISEAARIAGKDRREVGKMLKKYQINRDCFVHDEANAEPSHVTNLH